MPGFIGPCLATLCDKAPSGDQWLHEIKFDGYRLIVVICPLIAYHRVGGLKLARA
jgi:ATP-dependent DNA ligase